MHVIQLKHPNYGRRVGIVEEPSVILLNRAITSAYQLFKEIINNNKSQLFTIQALRTTEVIKYDDVYQTYKDIIMELDGDDETASVGW